MSEIKLITLTNYVRPPLMEDKSRDWVMNGKLNQYYSYIVDRNNGSPTNASMARPAKNTFSCGAFKMGVRRPRPQNITFLMSIQGHPKPN